MEGVPCRPPRRPGELRLLPRGAPGDLSQSVSDFLLVVRLLSASSDVLRLLCQLFERTSGWSLFEVVLRMLQVIRDCLTHWSEIAFSSVVKISCFAVAERLLRGCYEVAKRSL